MISFSFLFIPAFSSFSFLYMHANFPVKFSSWPCSVLSHTFMLNTGIFSGIRKAKWYKDSWEFFSHLGVITNKVCVVQYSCSCSCSWSYTQRYPHFPGSHLWHRHSSWLKTLSFLWPLVASMEVIWLPAIMKVPSGLQLGEKFLSSTWGRLHTISVCLSQGRNGYAYVGSHYPVCF